jgi:hypothetical protein
MGNPFSPGVFSFALPGRVATQEINLSEKNFSLSKKPFSSHDLGLPAPEGFGSGMGISILLPRPGGHSLNPASIKHSLFL